MTYDVFIKKLSLLYTRDRYCVRWFMQESTFSYEIFPSEHAFVPGYCVFTSEVYWHSKLLLPQILKNIETELDKLS